MTTLRDLVAQWRAHDERLLRENPGDDPIAMQARGIAASRLGRADELEARLNALSASDAQPRVGLDADARAYANNTHNTQTEGDSHE